ncbi:hypothetical protein [Haloplanus aerogenes]|uniref:DUF8048 domain-containing protein n=1 Tax=Haloplanus aerogenes TaxID=660522 RepID=A0A3M0CXF8_9EURY|nr:hypothetical protein [Haloplanus aerogenes]AZH24027.1 hypothetical protein DU502_00950 [Haloplanus aerogenes]RMB13200.1 hypothetical protein ATH50_2532 [Haloplanus aerogenes]
MTNDATVDTGEAPISGAVVERVAEGVDPDAPAIADALLALNAELLGRHAEFERTADYVTVDGTRAYRIDRDEWATLIDEFDFEDPMAAAVRITHTEQARLLFTTAVDADDRFTPDEAGVVVGIDTAEQF